MPPHDRVGAIPQMRGKRCARANRGGNLLRGGIGMADTGYYTFGGDGFYVANRLRPVGREGHDADLIAGDVLPTMKLIQIRRADPAAGMRAARSVVGRDMRPFHVETLNRAA